MSARAKQIMFGYIQTQAVFAAVELGVADALDDGPQPLGALAERTGADPDALGRLLDLLCRLGLFAKPGPVTYAHTDDSRCLSTRHESSLADLLLFCGVESYKTFGHLAQAVRTGGPVFQEAWGQPFWGHLQENPDRRVMFARAMERQSEAMLRALAAKYDFDQHGHVVDVGGGKGQLFRPLRAAGFSGRATVMDQPSLADAAAAFIAESGLEDVTFEGGDFFAAVPGGGDLYVLKFVLHDWGDAESVRILERVRADMPAGAKVMLIELCLGGGPSPWSHLSDMIMLTTFGAKERDEAQYRALLGAAGLQLDASLLIDGSHFALIASAAG